MNNCYYLLLLLSLWSCQDATICGTIPMPGENVSRDAKTTPVVLVDNKAVQKNKRDTFGRKIIVEKLQEKIKNKIPLVVHIHIPLCDNQHQGIVPTSKSLGDGMSTRTNLYWATSSGTKKYFQKHKLWQQIYNQNDIDTNILERIVFERTYADTKVYLVADAYRGDRMEETINDYLAALACQRTETLTLAATKEQIPLSGGADLLIFNGHNGMMDNVVIKEWVNDSDERKDAVINACATFGYFEEELRKAKAYPLLRTTNLLHPGAYVLTAVIDDWVHQQSMSTIAKNANKAYCKTQGCKSTKLYKWGWNVEDFQIE